MLRCFVADLRFILQLCGLWYIASTGMGICGKNIRKSPEVSDHTPAEGKVF
jgi:hypothetical protein